MKRANFLGAPAAFNLNHACRAIADAFDPVGVFLVGSAHERRDYRDVDVRCILSDEEFARLFPVAAKSRASQHDAAWSLVCCAISEWLSSRTGLPIDFQFQAMTRANDEYPGPEHKRQSLGLFLSLPEGRP